MITQVVVDNRTVKREQINRELWLYITDDLSVWWELELNNNIHKKGSNHTRKPGLKPNIFNLNYDTKQAETVNPHIWEAKYYMTGNETTFWVLLL